MVYKLVIFDFDGTWADSFPWFVEIVNRAALKYRFKRIDTDELEALRGYEAAQMVKHLQIPFWKVPLIARHMRRTMRQHRGQVQLFEGIDRLFAHLTQHGVLVAIVTSNSYDIVQHVLGPDLVRHVAYFACDVPVYKKAAQFRNVHERSGVAAEDVLCVGDEIRDIKAAQRAGLAFGVVAWGFTHLRALTAYAPRETFASVDDMIAKLT